MNALESDRSDADIIARSVRAPEIFGAIFDRHAVAVHRFVARRSDRETADDLLSDVFATAFRHRDRFDPASESALPWLYGIALNALRRSWRTASSRQRTARRAAGDLTPVEGSHEETSVRRLDAARQWEIVRPVVEALADGDRQALLLYAWEELTYAQIAIALEIPVGTVRSRINRARTQVQTGLDQLMTKETHDDR